MNPNRPAQPPPPPGRRRWRWVFLLPAFGGLIVIAAVVAFAIFRLSNAAAIRRLEAEARKRGEPVTLAELAATYPPISDETNGAARLLEIWEKESPEYWRAFREGRSPLPERRSATAKVDRALPFLGTDARPIPRVGALQPTTLALIESYLNERMEHIEAVRAAFRYPHFWFPIQITNGIAALLPHLSEIKREAQTFRLGGLLAVEHGGADAAIASMEDVARAGTAMCSEPFLLSQMVRIACYALILDDLERLLSHQTLSLGQLERLDNLLEQLKLSGALRYSLLAERACGLGVFDMSSEAIAQLGAASDDSGDSNYSSSHAGIGVLRVTGILDSDKRFLLETMAKAIALAERDDAASRKELEDVFRNIQPKALRFPPKIVSAMLLPARDRAAARFTTLEARRRAAAVALAIERYRIAHDGNLPEQLGQLVPQFLPRVPEDPFDGKPLRFKALQKGFVAYSVGADRVDNGGKEHPKQAPIEGFDVTFIVER